MKLKTSNQNAWAMLEEIVQTKEPIVITKQGKPLVKIVPIDKTNHKPLKGAATYVGDIISPIDENW